MLTLIYICVCMCIILCNTATLDIYLLPGDIYQHYCYEGKIIIDMEFNSTKMQISVYDSINTKFLGNNIGRVIYLSDWGFGITTIKFLNTESVPVQLVGDINCNKTEFPYSWLENTNSCDTQIEYLQTIIDNYATYLIICLVSILVLLVIIVELSIKICILSNKCKKNTYEIN